MEPVNLDAFSGRDMQNMDALLLKLERSGVDVRFPRQQIATAVHRLKLEGRRNRNKPVATKASKNNKKQKVDSRTHMLCPLCRQAYLRARSMVDPITSDTFTDIYCSNCRHSAEFK